MLKLRFDWCIKCIFLVWSDHEIERWDNNCAKINGQDTVGREDSAKENDILKQELRDLRLFAKEFGQGVRQQRVREKRRKSRKSAPRPLP